DWCIGCRECEKVCKQNAINVINGKAVVDKERCVLCSYCAPRCKEFCIKII
nr:4Fe-4S binding protein [Acetoanaerobium sp.]MBP9562333.1 4Fe-4S binding protein [Acetoanaerobium sp.]